MHTTFLAGETEALGQAATLVKNSLEPCSPTVFLTDALSVLEVLQTNKSPLLAIQMQELGNTCRVVLQWIPHCGIPGNEQADQLSTYGAQEEQPSNSIHYQEKTTIIKTALKPRQEKDAYHLLDMLGQVVLARLRSGHNRLNAHMQRKLKIVPSPTRPCGDEDQTTEHVLQRCNRHQSERIAQWPSATPIHQKLLWGFEDLKKTTNFITAVGLVM